MPDSDSSHPLPDDRRTEPAYEASRYALRNLETTDRLAFRWVAESELLRGLDLLDLGCGAGRSSRFLTDLGNRVTGVDANADMIHEAERFTSDGEPGPRYLHLPRGEPLPFPDGRFGGGFSSWMILEEGDDTEIVRLFREVGRILQPGAPVLVVTNTPEFYSGRWLSCRVEEHPENRPPLRSGQVVKATLLSEKVVVTDHFWSDADYCSFFEAAGFEVVGSHRPLGRPEDELPWLDELHTAPYVVYHLEKPQLPTGSP